MLSKLKRIFKFIFKSFEEKFMEQFRKNFGNFFGFNADLYMSKHFEDLFLNYFKKHFSYKFTEELEAVIKYKINEHIDEIFSKHFDEEFRNKISNFEIQTNDIFDCIVKAETKLKKGNGKNKLALACEYYMEKQKDEILEYAKEIIKSRAEQVFQDNKEKVNKLVLETPICL